MSELAADISDLKTQIVLYQPQLNTKGFGTKIRRLQNESTILIAQHGLIMLHLFFLDDQEMKPGISRPATIQSA
jgi:hypothetical protein